jgi:tetratricopeptide (TPR) repeat protein
MAGVEEISPRFVVEATTLLTAGKALDAITVCRNGIAKYPWYATGYWVLGKCYERQGDLAAAYAQYSEVARRLQGIEAVKNALERTRAKGNTTAAKGGTDLDALMLKLQEVKRVIPSVSDTDILSVDMSASRQEELPIVTVTLAEIFAKQGRYKEALEAYKQIVQQRPDEAGRLAERMAELERLL